MGGREGDFGNFIEFFRFFFGDFIEFFQVVREEKFCDNGEGSEVVFREPEDGPQNVRGERRERERVGGFGGEGRFFYGFCHDAEAELFADGDFHEGAWGQFFGARVGQSGGIGAKKNGGDYLVKHRIIIAEKLL